jgi:hypothetical protein
MKFIINTRRHYTKYTKGKPQNHSSLGFSVTIYGKKAYIIFKSNKLGQKGAIVGRRRFGQKSKNYIIITWNRVTLEILCLQLGAGLYFFWHWVPSKILTSNFEAPQ